MISLLREDLEIACMYFFILHIIHKVNLKLLLTLFIYFYQWTIYDDYYY